MKILLQSSHALVELSQLLADYLLGCLDHRSNGVLALSDPRTHILVEGADLLGIQNAGIYVEVVDDVIQHLNTLLIGKAP